MAKDLLLSLQLPHWLLIAGALLVIVGCTGLLIRRKASAEVSTIRTKSRDLTSSQQKSAQADGEGNYR
jgi:hypothetical protein